MCRDNLTDDQNIEPGDMIGNEQRAAFVWRTDDFYFDPKCQGKVSVELAGYNTGEPRCRHGGSLSKYREETA